MKRPAAPSAKETSSRPCPLSGQEAACSTELQRTLRALRTLSAGNRTLLRASDETELLHDMCRVIVDEGGYRVASVGYKQDDERKSVRVMACVGEGAHLLQSLPLRWGDNDTGKWAIGTAIRTGQPSVGRNLLDEPVYAMIREGARLHGYASASAFPLRIGGEVIGALTILAREPDAFDESELKLLEELANDLAYGIANLRMRVKHEEAERTIQRMALRDPLTELPNRLAFREHLRDCLHEARQGFRPLAVMVIKVAQLDEINETVGYSEGDLFVQAIASRVSPCAGEADMVARVGEDEFALLLTGVGADHATHIARRLISALREPVDLAEFAVDARASVGIALFPGHGTDADLLLRRAAVAAGRAHHAASGYLIYSGTPDNEVNHRLALMGELRRAIAKDELALYCQPKVRMDSGHTCGAEALVRWQHPRHGMLSTGDFIRIAEHAGLITPLTHWVLEAAFRQSYAWADAGLLQPLSVNLSAYDLRDPHLVDRVQGLFATWGTRPDLIQFELTEGMLMEDPASALRVLSQLKDLGVELFVDDFGTGYSSLSYLQKLPVDSLKIDQSFVTSMLTNKDSEIIVHSTVELGHNLGLEVVAEGVENEAAWQHLYKLGCDTAQGYFISMPLPAADFPQWEERSRWHDGGRCPPALRATPDRPESP